MSNVPNLQNAHVGPCDEHLALTMDLRPFCPLTLIHNFVFRPWRFILFSTAPVTDALQLLFYMRLIISHPTATSRCSISFACNLSNDIAVSGCFTHSAPTFPSFSAIPNVPVICIGKLTFTVSMRLSKIHYQAMKFCWANSRPGTSAALTCCAYEIPFKTFPVYQELLSAQLSDEWWKESLKIKPVSGHFHHITYKIHENLTPGMATVECSYVTVSKSHFIEV